MGLIPKRLVGFLVATNRPALNRRCLTTSSVSLNNSAPKKDESLSKGSTDLQVADGESKVLGKKKVSIFGGGSDVPMNINFPNKKGVGGYDPDYSVKDLLKTAPQVAKEQAKAIHKEIKEYSISVEKTEMLEDIGLLRHNEARVEYRFDTPEALALWHKGCDSDWNEGFSKCELEATDSGTAIFRGSISSEVVKDGRIERAGWASVKLEDRRALNRKKFFSRWKNFSHLLIKCRGDGRSYKVMLHSPLSMDFTWGDSFSYPLHTHGGPYWQYEKIPFSKFFHTVNGRIQDRQYPVNLEDTSSVSIVLMDRLDGDFKLELDYIGVYNDRSHIEEFAYETYTLPLFNTHGF